LKSETVMNYKIDAVKSKHMFHSARTDKKIKKRLSGRRL
jgi:hypothetical protein